jgi:pyrroloquinoline quinone biosynthesis protein B
LLAAAALLGCVATDPGEPPIEKAARPGQVRLRVLGTAQDGGFPHAACGCARCELAREDPHRERLVASLALMDSDDRVFLFDATPDIRRQLERLRDVKPSTGRVDRAPVDGVFLTHAHLGHYTGLGFFGFEAIHTSELPLYATPRMIEYLSANGPWSQLFDLGNVKPMPMVPGEPLRLGGKLEVTAFHVPHRDEFADTVGFLIAGPSTRLAYVPDTDGWDVWDTPLADWLDGNDVDVAVLDGTFFSMDELPGRDVSSIGHPCVTDTIERLRERVATGKLRVFFTHFNHSNPLLDADGKRRKQVEAAGFELLDDGFELPL